MAAPTGFAALPNAPFVVIVAALCGLAVCLAVLTVIARSRLWWLRVLAAFALLPAFVVLYVSGGIALGYSGH